MMELGTVSLTPAQTGKRQSAQLAACQQGHHALACLAYNMYATQSKIERDAPSCIYASPSHPAGRMSAVHHAEACFAYKAYDMQRERGGLRICHPASRPQLTSSWRHAIQQSALSCLHCLNEAQGKNKSTRQPFSIQTNFNKLERAFHSQLRT